MANSSSLLQVSDLSVVYPIGPNENIVALDKVSLDIPATGNTIGIVGESGSGKTTLGLSILNVIQPPGKIQSGDIDFVGQSVLRMSNRKLRDYRWEQVAMVFQYAMNSLSPVSRVVDPITEVIVEHGRGSRREAEKTALDLLSRVGIDRSRAYDYPNQFSGGMRQRVVIALALALSPKILIVDEPTSALDVVVQKQILALLKKEVAERGLSLLFITHEIALLPGLVQDLVVMYRGEIVEKGKLDDVFSQPLHPYTEMLIGSALTFSSTIDLREKTAPAIQRPSANSCPYVHRCKYAFQRCREEKPILIESKGGRYVACHKYS